MTHDDTERISMDFRAGWNECELAHRGTCTESRREDALKMWLAHKARAEHLAKLNAASKNGSTLAEAIEEARG